MKTNTESSMGKRRFGWLIVLSVVALLALFAVWRSARLSGAMSAAASTNQSMEQAEPGTVSKVVLEITDANAEGLIHGKLLKKKTEEIYTRTSELVMVKSTAQTRIVMGKASDVHAGAVVHVTGKVQADHSLDAEQIVILTGYVKVE